MAQSSFFNPDVGATRVTTGQSTTVGGTPGVPPPPVVLVQLNQILGTGALDTRYNVPRIGRVKIAHGLDAADCAFSTTFGDARLLSIQVWAYQVNSALVAVGDPIDMSKRLDGTLQIRCF